MAADGQREEGRAGEGLREAAEMASVPLYGTGVAESVREGWPGEAGEGPGKEVLQAVGTAMERYLEEQGLRKGNAPERYVDRLLYRSLRSVGEDGAAGRWARWAFPGEKGRPAVDPEFWPGPVPVEVWRLFESRVVRPLRSRTADGRRMWIFDFQCWQQEEEWLELTLLPGVRSILEQLAWGWDPSGSGVLGLRGVPGGAGETGWKRKGRIVERSAAERIRRYCEDVLERVAKERGWAGRPDVVFAESGTGGEKGRRG